MSQPRTRVLVVDDEPSVLLEISGALKRHYDVVTAQSAEEAESILAKERAQFGPPNRKYALTSCLRDLN